MTTPLGLAKRMRLAFPEFLETRLLREAPYTLRVLCVLEPGAPEVPRRLIDAWLADNKMAHTEVLVDQVRLLPASLVDEEVLLRQTSLPRIAVEEGQTSHGGFEKGLLRAFPGRIARIVGGSAIVIEVAQGTPKELQAEIRTAARLLLPCDPESLTVVETSTGQGQAPERSLTESSEVVRQLDADIALLHDMLPKVLSLDSEGIVGSPLPVGANTFASPHDGIDSLMQRLALFDHVYVQMPFAEGDFPQWAGATLQEFLSVLPTGRVVPVFTQSLDRYEPGLMSRVVEAGPPRVLHRGEAALRSIRGFAADHPFLAIVDTAEGVELRRALRQATEDEAAPFRRYSDAIADVADRLAMIALNGDTLAVAWHPIACWLDAFFRAQGLREHELEFAAALDHRATTESLDGTPLSKGDHYLDGFLRILYGVHAVETALLSVPDPTIIGRIAFPHAEGLGLREFAEAFKGPAVTSMRALMQTRRVQSAEDSEGLVRDFNRELLAYSRRSVEGYAATGVLLTYAGTLPHLGLPTALFGLCLELARRVVGRKAPRAFASLTAKLTGTTREAALLAQVRKGAP